MLWQKRIFDLSSEEECLISEVLCTQLRSIPRVGSNHGANLIFSTFSTFGGKLFPIQTSKVLRIQLRSCRWSSTVKGASTTSPDLVSCLMNVNHLFGREYLDCTYSIHVIHSVRSKRKTTEIIEIIFDNWKDSPGDFETLITILTIENLNSWQLLLPDN